MQFFGTDIKMSVSDVMQLTYLISPNLTDRVKIAIEKNLLPKPLGVGIQNVFEYDAPFFGFSVDTLQDNNMEAMGFNEINKLEGQFLTDHDFIL